MPGRNIYFNTQIKAMRHNQEIVCHQLLYVLLIFIYECKDVFKIFNWQIFIFLFISWLPLSICNRCLFFSI